MGRKEKEKKRMSKMDKTQAKIEKKKSLEHIPIHKKTVY